MNISILIPLYNERDNIPIIYREIKAQLESLKCVSEIVFVDDGSNDGSLEALQGIRAQDSSVKIIAFKKNYGQSAALKVGFDRVCGDIIVTMDADLQNDPADIPRLISYIESGYDMVSGWRRKRKDSLSKKIISRTANLIRNKITGDTIRDTGCMLKVYRKNFLKKIKIYNGFHRFLPTLFKIEGAKVIEIEVNHRERKFGRSKYSIKNRFLKPFWDTFIIRWMKKNHLVPEIKEEL